MSRERFFSVAILLFILGIFSLMPSPYSAYADTDSIQAQIDSITQQKAKLDAEIAQYQKQLDALGTQRQTLQSTVQSLTVSQSQLTSKISSTQKSINAANLQLSQLSSQIGTTQEAIDLDTQAVASSLRDIQMKEDLSIPELIFSKGSLGEVWLAVDENQQVMRTLQEHAEDLADEKRTLTTHQEAVSSKKTELSDFQADLSTQHKQLTVTKQAQQTLLTQTKNQETTYQQLIAKKRAEEAAFEAQLFQLASQLKSADRSGLPPAGKGILRWPLDSIRITQYFGKTSDSVRLYTSGTHDGVDFAASVGTPVKAALSGTVYAVNEGAVQNCQYGKWVLVKHPNGLATLYAHLSSIDVKSGESVGTGEVVGYAGMTGYATGPHLHFTVYVADSVTLKQYTCKSGYTVTIPIAPTNGYLDPMVYL